MALRGYVYHEEVRRVANPLHKKEKLDTIKNSHFCALKIDQDVQ